MAKLTDDIKTFVVQQLAQYRTPTQVAEDVSVNFGVKIERNQVFKYDPDGAAGSELAQRWKDLHAATRKAFLETTAGIPVAQRSYRLMKIQGVVERAEQMGNSKMVLEALEQAAKEEGDVFTNRQKIEASVGRTHEDWLALLPPPEPWKPPADGK